MLMCVSSSMIPCRKVCSLPAYWSAVQRANAHPPPYSLSIVVPSASRSGVSLALSRYW